jgi:Zn finger protein HypA/HybF involved in hydrogenase expression
MGVTDMAFTYQYKICPNCAVSFFQGRDDGPGMLGATLDGRRIFLRDDNALLMCHRCGLEIVLQKEVRCKKKGCNNPAYKLIMPACYNQYEAHGYCSMHWPRWIEDGGVSRLLNRIFVGKLPAIPFVDAEVTDECKECGATLACSNKQDAIRCPRCNTNHLKVRKELRKWV